MRCFVWGGRNDIGYFVQGGQSVWDVLSMMTMNGIGGFGLGCFVQDGKYYTDCFLGGGRNDMMCFSPECFVKHSHL